MSFNKPRETKTRGVL